MCQCWHVCVPVQGKQYAAIELPPDLGLDCQRYKWRQNQSHVEVFIPLPPGVPASKVRGHRIFV